jgi:hypothetical protein
MISSTSSTIVGPSALQEDCGKDERDGELEPRRNVLLAKAGQQHHHGSGAGKDQQEGRPDCRKEGHVEVHG